MVKEFLFPTPTDPQHLPLRISPFSATEEQKRLALVRALAFCLWQVGGQRHAYLVFSSDTSWMEGYVGDRKTPPAAEANRGNGAGAGVGEDKRVVVGGGIASSLGESLLQEGERTFALAPADSVSFMSFVSIVPPSTTNTTAAPSISLSRSSSPFSDSHNADTENHSKAPADCISPLQYVHVYNFSTLLAATEAYVDVLLSPGGLIFLLYSIVLTRGLAELRADFGRDITCMIADDSCSEQVRVNKCRRKRRRKKGKTE